MNRVSPDVRYKIRLKKNKALTLMAMTALFGAGCGKKQAMSFDRPPSPVTVAAAVTQDVPVYLDQIGKCVAREVVEIRPQVSGRIMNIHFADGANIKKDELLFTIDPRPFQASLRQAEANLAR